MSENGLDMALDDLIGASGKGKGKSRKGRGKGSKDSWSDWSGGGRGSDKWDAGSSSGGRSGKDALDMALDDLVSSDDRGKGKGKGKKGRDKGSEDSWSDWKGGSGAWSGGGSDRWGNGSSSKWSGGGSSSQDWGGWGRSGVSRSDRDRDRDSWGTSRRPEPERWESGRGGGGRDRGFSWAGSDREPRGGERYGGDGWDPHRGTKRGRDDANNHRATKSKVIKVTNIPLDLTDEDITEAFEAETGKILSCDMKRGTAMIRFARAEDAMKAAETFDRGELNGKIIMVTVEPGY